jgi:hypothetical protein
VGGEDCDEVFGAVGGTEGTVRLERDDVVYLGVNDEIQCLLPTL